MDKKQLNIFSKFKIHLCDVYRKITIKSISLLRLSLTHSHISASIDRIADISRSPENKAQTTPNTDCLTDWPTVFDDNRHQHTSTAHEKKSQERHKNPQEKFKSP